MNRQTEDRGVDERRVINNLLRLLKEHDVMKNDATSQSSPQHCETSQSDDGIRAFWRRAIGCAILVATALVASSCSDAPSSAKLREKGESTYFRANFHCVLRDEDAMVIDSSAFVSEGTIYLFRKEGDGWRLASHTDITEYLKGDYVAYIETETLEEFEDLEQVTPLVYNDGYVVVLTTKTDEPAELSNDVGSALVFKRTGDSLEFRARIPKILPRCVSLSDDNFLTATALERETKSYYLEEFDLNGATPELSQKILPPVVDREEARNSYGLKENSSREFQPRFMRNGDYLLVGSYQDVFEKEGVNDADSLSTADMSKLDVYAKGKSFGGKLYALPTDYLLFHKVDGAWRYEQSLLNLIPREFYLSHKRNPLSHLVRCELGGERIQLSFYNLVCSEKGLIEFQRDESTGRFNVATIDFKKFLKDGKENDDTHDDASRVNLAIQERDAASVTTMNKATQLGILPPSGEKTPRVLAPKWTVGSGDPETTALFLDYYKNNLVADFIEKYGYDNFYDWTDAVPTLHYSIDGSDLLVSYVFKDSFFAGYPMQKADVWAGVDFYRIDAERGPIKVSSFVTRDLKPLAPR